MKVAFLLPSLTLGGAETRTVDLALRLRQSNCAVSVATLRAQGDFGLLKRLASAGVHLCVVGAPQGWRELRTFYSREPVEEPRVLHSAMTSAGLVGLALRRWTGAPLLHSFTNTLRSNRLEPPSCRSFVAGAADALLVRRADAVHAVSPDLHAQLRSAFPGFAQKVTSVPDWEAEAGFDEADSAAQMLAALEVPAASLRVLVLGRTVEHKDQGMVLDALPMVVAGRPDVHVVIAGDGAGLANLRQHTARLGMTPHVTFAGSTRSPRSFLLWADVLVHCSQYDGLPRACVEAANLEVPIIMANHPAAREVSRRFPRSTLLVPSRNSVALARVLLRQAARPPEDRLKSESLLPPSTLTRQLLQLYTRLTEDTRRD